MPENTYEVDLDAPPPKRRKTSKDIKHLNTLSADDFVKNLGLLAGPQAVVSVDGEEFKLPKHLLCYYSPYFNAALNGRFTEAAEQKVTLVNTSASTFRLAIQWLYQGRVTVPQPEPKVISYHDLDKRGVSKYKKMLSTKGDSEQMRKNVQELAQSEFPMEAKATACIDFLKLADYLDFLGPFGDILDELGRYFKDQPLRLDEGYIREAMSFPVKHPFRLLVVQIISQEYFRHLFWRVKRVFRWQKEIDTIDELAVQVLRECGKVFEDKNNAPLLLSNSFMMRVRLGNKRYRFKIDEI